jgi:hypothetical protein
MTDSSTPVWRKSSSCAAHDCVEVAFLDDGQVAVRDSKGRQGPLLLFTPDEWRTFLEAARVGEFDLKAP